MADEDMPGDVIPLKRPPQSSRHRSARAVVRCRAEAAGDDDKGAPAHGGHESGDDIILPVADHGHPAQFVTRQSEVPRNVGGIAVHHPAREKLIAYGNKFADHRDLTSLHAR
jgi:hypothetical protein